MLTQTDHYRTLHSGAAGQRFVTAGVSASPESLSAARFAAHQADLAELPLRLLHAYPEATQTEPGGRVLARATAAENLLNEVRVRLMIEPTHGVRLCLVLGSPLGALTSAAASSGMLVVGHQAALLGGRPPVGSLVSRVAAHASCPVATVPRNWTPRHLTRPVVVALDGRSSTAALLAYGFREASRKEGELVLVHAVTPGRSRRGAEPDLADVEEQLAPWVASYPEVPLRRVLSEQDTATTIVDLSRLASEVVVGHPHEQNRLPHWYRSTAHAVMEASQCPLVILPAGLDASRPAVARSAR